MGSNGEIAKPIWTSKTFWLNVIGVVLVLGNYLLTIVPVSSEFYTLIATLMGILNIGNRFQTQDRVTLK